MFQEPATPDMGNQDMPITSFIHPEDQKRLQDFIDLQRLGTYRANDLPRTIEEDARMIGEGYNIRQPLNDRRYADVIDAMLSQQPVTPEFGIRPAMITSPEMQAQILRELSMLGIDVSKLATPFAQDNLIQDIKKPVPKKTKK